MVPQVPCVGCGVLGSPTCLGPVRWPHTVKVSVLGERTPLTCDVNLSSAHRPANLDGDHFGQLTRREDQSRAPTGFGDVSAHARCTAQTPVLTVSRSKAGRGGSGCRPWS